MNTGRPEAGAHYAGLYNKAQYELAALREELAACKRSNEIIRNQRPSEIFDQRLTAAEQRNADLVELLRRSSPGDGQDFKQWWNERATLLLAALKPTESGASE
jgi:hypothetical protein